METKFQTSFIPKKVIGTPTGLPSEKPPRHVGSLFMMIAVILFIVSLGGLGASYMWKRVLNTSQVSLKQELTKREKQFNVDLIERLKQANIKIDLASGLVNKHVALSEIFNIINRFIVEKVRITSMDVSAPTKDGENAKLSMSGYGTSLSVIAYQSDVLGQLEQYGLRKIVKNPMMNNPSLNTSGAVSFGFSAEIDPSYLTYRRSLGLDSDENASSTPNNP